MDLPSGYVKKPDIQSMHHSQEWSESTNFNSPEPLTTEIPGALEYIASVSDQTNLPQSSLDQHNLSKNAAVAVLQEVVTDIKSDDKKILALSLVGATAVSQFLDRSRMVLIFGPQIAIEAAERTNNSFIGGLAVAGLFSVTNFAVGETLTQAMDRFPSAKDTFKERFPKTLQVFKDSLAGIESKELVDEPDDAEVVEAPDTKIGKLDRIRAKVSRLSLEVSQGVQNSLNVFETPEQKLKRKLYSDERYSALTRVIGDEEEFSLRIKRAGTGIGLGSTAFVATSSIEGHDKETVRSINYKVTHDTAVLITAIGTGVIESIKRMYMQGWYDAAKRVDDIVSDGRTWLGVAGFTILSTFISNRIAYKKLDKEEQAQNIQEDTAQQSNR
jgi:hypothetical protein